MIFIVNDTIITDQHFHTRYLVYIFAACWKQRDGDYVKEGHGEENDCYATFEEAKERCYVAGDCMAIAVQNNICGGKFRITHGGPTFKAESLRVKKLLAVRSYEYICSRGNFDFRV